MRWLTALLMWGGGAVTVVSAIAVVYVVVVAPTRGRHLWGAYDALCGAYRGGFGRRHSWLVTATEKRVVGLIEIAA